MAKTMTGRKAVNFTEAQNAVLQEIARGEGSSVSALIRRAVIQQFRLPTGAPERSTMHENGAPNTNSQAPVVKNATERADDAERVSDAVVAAAGESDATASQGADGGGL